MMEWTLSNMAPWQSQQYCSAPRKDNSLTVSLSLSPPRPLTAQPRPRRHRKHRRREAESARPDDATRERKKGKPVVPRAQLICCTQRCLFFSPEDFWWKMPDFLYFFCTFGETKDRISPCGNSQANLINDVQVSIAFMTTTSHPVSKCVSRRDPRCTLNVPACSTLCLLSVACVSFPKMNSVCELDVVWRVLRSSVFCPGPRGTVFICVFCLSRCLNINTGHFSSNNEAALHILTSAHFHTAQ